MKHSDQLEVKTLLRNVSSVKVDFLEKLVEEFES